MTNNNFNITRLIQYIRRQLILNVSSMWIAFGAVFGALLIISFLIAKFNPIAVSGLPVLYTVVLFFSGYLFSSRIFSEMNHPQRSYLFLTLPVSTSEKLLGSWFVSGPIFAMVFSALGFLMYEAAKLVAAIDLPGAPFGEYFTQNYFRTLAVFLITQTIFFLGGTTFKGNNFLKTLLSLFVISVGILIVTAIAARIILPGTQNSFDFSLEFRKGTESMFSNIMPIFFWYVMGPFLLIVSYFKLKEREI